MGQIRVLVVDDHGLMVEAVRLALDREKDIEIVGDARTGGEVLPEVARRQPDIVLLDIRLPDIDGLTVLERLRARRPDVKVVMLSAIGEPAIARRALELGAVAYFDKHVDPGTLASSLRQIMAGSPPASSGSSSDRSALPLREFVLTPRERQVLAHVAKGRSNSEVAGELWLSEQTVKYHLTNIYRKLGVKGRTGAVRYAFEHGLINQID
jgi:DNA-binding NarL/FixJ family response regulator